MEKYLPDEKPLEVKLIRHQLKTFGEYCERHSGQPDFPITTIPKLNDKLWGFERQNLVTIGARTSNCKTALACQLAYDFASSGHRVLYLSLEMSIGEAMKRFFCHSMQIDNSLMRSNAKDLYENNKASFADHLKDQKLILMENYGQSCQQIYRILKEVSPTPDIIFLDYIQCIRAGGNKKLEAIDEFIKGFRNLALEHNFCGCVVSQINRSNIQTETKEPSMDGLKGSGFLEEHSDKILLLHWDYHYDSDKDKNKIKVAIAKNKNGETGYMGLSYYPEFYLFADPPKEAGDEHQEELDIYG